MTRQFRREKQGKNGNILGYNFTLCDKSVLLGIFLVRRGPPKRSVFHQPVFSSIDTPLVVERAKLGDRIM